MADIDGLTRHKASRATPSIPDCDYCGYAGHPITLDLPGLNSTCQRIFVDVQKLSWHDCIHYEDIVYDLLAAGETWHTNGTILAHIIDSRIAV